MMRQTMRLIILILILVSPPLAAKALGQTVEQIGPVLSRPWGMAFISPDEVVVTERRGRLWRINLTTGAGDKIAGVPEVFARGQGGLLDVLAHDGWLYLCYSRRVEGGAGTAMMRARLSDGDLRPGGGLRLTDKVEMFVSNTPQSGSRHFGCRMVAQDGAIYLSIGDRGMRDDSQVMTSHSGAVIRMPLEGGEGGGDAVGTGQSDGSGGDGSGAHIFTKGHRNPQGMAIHPESGAIWVSEHGPRGGDEINILAEGANYGWPQVSHGREYYGGKVGEGLKSAPGYVDPVWVWVPSIAPGGMAFYEGDMFGQFKGDVLVASLKFRSLYHVEIEAGLPVRETPLLKGEIGRIRDVAVAADGSILLLSDESSGGLYRFSK